MSEQEIKDIDCPECHQAYLVKDYEHGQAYLVCPACGYNRPE